MCSLNARNEGQSGCFPDSELEKIQCRAGGLTWDASLTHVQKFMTMLENQT